MCARAGACVRHLASVSNSSIWRTSAAVLSDDLRCGSSGSSGPLGSAWGHNRTSPLSGFCVAEMDSARTCKFGTTSFFRSFARKFYESNGKLSRTLRADSSMHMDSSTPSSIMSSIMPVSSMDSSRAESQQSTSQACLLARGLGHRGRRRPRVPAAAAVSVDCSRESTWVRASAAPRPAPPCQLSTVSTVHVTSATCCSRSVVAQLDII